MNNAPYAEGDRDVAEQLVRARVVFCLLPGKTDAMKSRDEIRRIIVSSQSHDLNRLVMFSAFFLPCIQSRLTPILEPISASVSAKHSTIGFGNRRTKGLKRKHDDPGVSPVLSAHSPVQSRFHIS